MRYLTGRGVTALTGGVRNAEFKDKVTSSEEMNGEVFSNPFKITKERNVLMVWTCDVCFECYQW